jgi:LDH2 family malate/lactate/ureidoglycolate dehydrogenase
MLRIPFEEMEQTICRAFIKAGLSENTAATCARIHTESSCDGVFSHGLNRVERFVDYLHRGWINPKEKHNCKPPLQHGKYMTEKWGRALPMPFLPWTGQPI